jgi:hypothetical protein
VPGVLHHIIQFVGELAEEPRKKIAQKCRRIGREFNTLFSHILLKRYEALNFDSDIHIFFIDNF